MLQLLLWLWLILTGLSSDNNLLLTTKSVILIHLHMPFFPRYLLVWIFSALCLAWTSWWRSIAFAFRCVMFLSLPTHISFPFTIRIKLSDNLKCSTSYSFITRLRIPERSRTSKQFKTRISNVTRSWGTTGNDGPNTPWRICYCRKKRFVRADWDIVRSVPSKNMSTSWDMLHIGFALLNVAVFNKFNRGASSIREFFLPLMRARWAFRLNIFDWIIF